jgi:hypothetical protein
MPRHHPFACWAVLLGPALIALLGQRADGQEAGGATLPKDPCALLKPADIQAALAPGATVAAGVPTTASLPLAESCSYTWGPRSRQWGDPSVMVMIMDASRAWPGLSADQVVQGVILSANGHKGEGSTISGIGDAAVFTFEPAHYNCKTQAFFAKKQIHLSLEFHGAGAPSCKDNLVALLKRAASRV